MSKNPMHQARIYVSPWRERLPSGDLGPPYGPSPSTLARHVARFKLWSYKPPSKEARQDTEAMIAFMRLPDGSLRDDVPAQEATVYQHVYERGHSVRWTARHLKLSRSSVRVYLRRLRERITAPQVAGY